MKCIQMIIFLVVFNYCMASQVYAAPAYGTKLPERNRISAGVQSHIIFDRDLFRDQGEMRSQQQFLMISYGVTDWISLDVKGGSGNIRQHLESGGQIRYETYMAGGYGFRMKFFEKEKTKAVFGFQHISVHPRTAVVQGVKHKAVLDDWQFSLLLSYDMDLLTPYLGARWSRMDYIHWQNGFRKRVKSDLDKSAGLIAGMNVPFSKNTWLNIEGNFIDATAVAASMNVSF